MRHASFSSAAVLLAALILCLSPIHGQKPVGAPAQDRELRFVVYLSRHGVRSPTGDASRYDRYSRAEWPVWDVPPGYLTLHGFELMKLFGSWDRALLAREGLLIPSGCSDAAQVTFVADSDQRTRQSGLALAKGMFPGCAPEVYAFPQGTRDPLFHPKNGDSPDPGPESAVAEARAEAAARKYAEQYHPQIAEMDHVLATCGQPSSADHLRTSLFDVPYSPRAGRSPHPGELRGPLSVAATLSENFLLEYTEDMPLRDVGWGCVTEPTLRSLMVLHTAASNYEHRNPGEARMAASKLLAHIRAAMEQAVESKPVPGALDRPGDRVLFLVGHDTNLATVAALLNLTWTADGRRDDTPPGSALVFELWRGRRSNKYFVRVYFTSQTLDQMRQSTELTPAHPPLTVPLAIGECPRADAGTCSWAAFSQLSGRAIDPDYVKLAGDGEGIGSRTVVPQSGR